MPYLILAWAMQLAAAASIARTLCTSRFCAGHWWLWQYRDGDGVTTSWERYFVAEVDADSCCVTIEMASKFEEDEPYNTHHRMRFNMVDALSAQESKDDWQYQAFQFRDAAGDWVDAPWRDNTQAFEEKFDVFEMTTPADVARSATCQRDIRAPLGAPRGATMGSTRASLSQSERHAYNGAWYVREPREHSGVCALKWFGEAVAADTFHFELVDFGFAAVADDGAPVTSATAASIEAASTLLAEYDAGHRAAAASMGAEGFGGALTANAWAARADSPPLAKAVRTLWQAASRTEGYNGSPRSVDDGRLILGICADDALTGVSALKAWVTELDLPKGPLHGMDKDGEPLDMSTFGAVYIK